MFKRNKCPLYALLLLFFIAIVLHFSFSQVIFKKNNVSKIEKNQVFLNNFETKILGHWSDGSNPTIDQGYIIVNADYPFSSTLRVETDSIPMEGRKVQISTFGYSEFPNDSVFAVLSIEQADKKVYYRAFPLNFKSGNWLNYRFEDVLPENIPYGSVLKYYIWNSSKNQFLVDELKLRIKYIYFPSME